MFGKNRGLSRLFRKNRIQQIPQRQEFETLEQRRLFTAITINFGASAETITVNYNANGMYFQAPGQSTYYTFTPNVNTYTVNGTSGTPSYFVLTGFAYTVNLLGGNDNLAVTSLSSSLTINAGDGNDTVAGTSHDDVIDGGNGNDLLSGLDGNDSVTGGAGDDVCNGNNGNDTLFGGADNDTLVGHSGADVMHGEGGFDTVDYHPRTAALWLSGDATANDGELNEGDDIGGTTGYSLDVETIIGGSAADVIGDYAPWGPAPWNQPGCRLEGRGGDDSITGSGFLDTLYGGDGNDTLSSGYGNSSYYGENGDDSIVGGDQADFFSGGAGNDTIYGNDGNDTINGDNDADYLSGDDGNDSITGGTGVDLFYGGYGDDTIQAQDSATIADAGISGGPGDNWAYIDTVDNWNVTGIGHLFQV